MLHLKDRREPDPLIMSRSAATLLLDYQDCNKAEFKRKTYFEMVPNF